MTLVCFRLLFPLLPLAAMCPFLRAGTADDHLKRAIVMDWLETVNIERWQGRKGKPIQETWTWRFRRAAEGAASDDEINLTLATGHRPRNSKHHFSWRGPFKLSKTELSGQSGYEWVGMKTPKVTDHSLELRVVRG